MECKCGYNGKPEYGEFEPENKEDIIFGIINMRCPKCHKRASSITVRDSVERDLRYPRLCYGPERKHSPVRRITTIQPPYHKDGVASYSTRCPYCHWGEAGGMSKEDYDYLHELLLKVNS